MPSGYPPVEDVVAGSTVDALTSLPIEEKQALYESSRLAVEEFCRQTFNYDPGTIRNLDGTGTKALYLPVRLDVLTSMVAGGSGLEVGDVEISESHDRLLVRSSAFETNYYTQAIRDFEGNLPLAFPYGAGNNSVGGDWGWGEVPEAVLRAIRRDMEDTALADQNALSHSIRAFRKLGLRDVSQGNLRADIAGAWGLSPEVMLLLVPYVWEGPIGITV
jgi:hypothetical protein